MPSVRNLAAQTALNPLTVAKAYRQLVEIGVVEMRHGVGVFLVSGGFERLRQYERTRFLTEEWPTICQHMQRLHLDRPTLIAAIPAAQRTRCTA